MIRKAQSLSRKRFRGGFIAAAAVFSALLPLPSLAVEVLKIGGTGSALGTMAVVASAYTAMHENVRIDIPPSLGSGGAVRALSKGALDIALVSRPLSEKELDLGLELMEYARTPLVFATNRVCPVNDITTDDLEKIYRGTLVRWSCGKGVRLVLRSASDSDTAAVQGISPSMRQAVDAALSRPGMLIAVSDQEAADILSRSPERFGTSTLALILSEKRSMKAFSFNGVAPGLETLADGSYPLGKTLSLATAAQRTALVQSFIDFLRSPEGAGILERYGNLPVRSPGGP